MASLVVPYDSNWKMNFEALADVLRSAIHDAGIDIDIQHVGSTSIPGMMAKPILDIDIIIPTEIILTDVSDCLLQLGYEARGDQGIPGRYAFRQLSAYTPVTPEKIAWQEHHLYVCVAGCLALRNHLTFRDALLKHHQLAAQYKQLKQSLTAGSKVDRVWYTKQKTSFIISVLKQAGFAPHELKAIEDANR